MRLFAVSTVRFMRRLTRVAWSGGGRLRVSRFLRLCICFSGSNSISLCGDLVRFVVSLCAKIFSACLVFLHLFLSQSLFFNSSAFVSARLFQ